MTGQQPLMTVAQVAEHLQLHRRTVIDLIAGGAGPLKASNLGGTSTHGARWRVAPRDLDRFVESRRPT